MLTGVPHFTKGLTWFNLKMEGIYSSALWPTEMPAKPWQHMDLYSDNWAPEFYRSRVPGKDCDQQWATICLRRVRSYLDNTWHTTLENHTILATGQYRSVTIQLYYRESYLHFPRRKQGPAEGHIPLLHELQHNRSFTGTSSPGMWLLH